MFDKKHYENTDIQEFSDEMLMNMDQHLHRVKLIEEFIKNGSILDLGCNNGMLSLIYTLNDKRRVVGIDLNKKAIKFCNKFLKRHNIKESEYIQKSIEDINLKEKFDNIFLCEVIEHVEDPIKVLDIAEKFLKPNGLIFITTPDYRGEYGISNTGDVDGEHLRLYKPDKLKSLIKKRGKILYFETRQLIYCIYTL